jgi:hypothetical protein
MIALRSGTTSTAAGTSAPHAARSRVDSSLDLALESDAPKTERDRAWIRLPTRGTAELAAGLSPPRCFGSVAQGELPPAMWQDGAVHGRLAGQLERADDGRPRQRAGADRDSVSGNQTAGHPGDP